MRVLLILSVHLANYSFPYSKLDDLDVGACQKRRHLQGRN